MTHTEASHLGKVLWAVDPTDKEDLALGHCVRKTVERLILSADPENPSPIEPVYVLRMNTAVTADVGAAWRADLVRAAEDELREYITRTKIPGLAKPRVLVNTASSLRLAADTLSEYAEETGADLIVSQTHGRSGISRAFMGSFAETLTTHSKVPLLLVSPKMDIGKRIDHILFPTDFSRHSSEQLRSVLDIAARFEARITLFHAIENEAEPISFSPMIGPSFSLPAHRREWERHFRKRAHHWSAIASSHGITLDFVLHDQTRDAARDILALAKSSDASLITMQSNTRSFSATLLGSVTRQVVRNAECPVWILKPTLKRMERKIPIRTQNSEIFDQPEL